MKCSYVGLSLTYDLLYVFILFCLSYLKYGSSESMFACQFHLRANKWVVIFEQSFDITFVTTSFSFFSLVKNNVERKMKRENKRIMWVWERKLSKSCHKMIVQISFLPINSLFHLLLNLLTIVYFPEKKEYVNHALKPLSS